MNIKRKLPHPLVLENSDNKIVEKLFAGARAKQLSLAPVTASDWINAGTDREALQALVARSQRQQIKPSSASSEQVRAYAESLNGVKIKSVTVQEWDDVDPKNTQALRSLLVRAKIITQRSERKLENAFCALAAPRVDTLEVSKWRKEQVTNEHSINSVKGQKLAFQTARTQIAVKERVQKLEQVQCKAANNFNTVLARKLDLSPTLQKCIKFEKDYHVKFVSSDKENTFFSASTPRLANKGTVSSLDSKRRIIIKERSLSFEELRDKFNK